MRGLGKLATAAVTAVAAAPISVSAQYLAPVKIGVIALLPGPAGPAFDVPARNAAEVLTGSLNAGKAGGVIHV